MSPQTSSLVIISPASAGAKRSLRFSAAVDLPKPGQPLAIVSKVPRQCRFCLTSNDRCGGANTGHSPMCGEPVESTLCRQSPLCRKPIYASRNRRAHGVICGQHVDGAMNTYEEFPAPKGHAHLVECVWVLRP